MILTLAACLLFLVAMAFVTRGIGKGVLPSPYGETLFAVPFGVVYGVVMGDWYALFGPVSTTGIQLGHSNIYHMGTEEFDFPYQPDLIDRIIKPVTDLLGFAPRSTPYCWFGMAVKGLVIGIAAAPVGLLIVPLWPICYWLSFVVLKKHSVFAEWASGPVCGCVLILSLILSFYCGIMFWTQYVMDILQR